MRAIKKIFHNAMFVMLIFFPLMANAQNSTLLCEGQGIADNGATKSNHMVRLSIIFNLINKSISIDKLQQIAPGSFEPIRLFEYTDNEIFFETPNEYFGGKGITQGKINRFTGGMNLHYANFGSSMGTGLASFQANLVCKQISSRQF